MLRLNNSRPYIPLPETGAPEDLYKKGGDGGGGGGNQVTGSGVIILPGFGNVTDSSVGGSHQESGQRKYVVGDLQATSVKQVKDIFVQLQAANDPRLSKWMKSVGVTDPKIAKEVWDDAATYAWSLASSGAKVDFFETIGSTNFQENYLSIPKSLLGGGAGATDPTRYVTLTDPAAAKLQLKKNMSAIAGREPTAAEYKEYVKQLNAAQKKAVTTVSYGNTQQTTQNNFDEEAFLLGYIIKKTDFKTLETGQAKGVIDGLTTLVNDYGIGSAVSETQKIALAKKWLTGELDETSVRQQMAKTAASYYPAFAEQMKATPTASLKEVASDYLSVYANILEADEDTINVKDALSKAQINNNGKYEVASLYDYEKTLRKTEQYQFTKRAHQEAASFGAAFARSMGVSI